MDFVAYDLEVAPVEPGIHPSMQAFLDEFPVPPQQVAAYAITSVTSPIYNCGDPNCGICPPLNSGANAPAPVINPTTSNATYGEF